MAISNISSGLRSGICTSTTRPTSPYEGQMVYQTDTDQLLIWTGTEWRSVASTETTANGAGGHSNIFSNSLSTTQASVVSAVRRVQGTEYVFTNLTFNMPSNANTDASDWTAPVDSSTYKWSYIYIRPTDNKFFISDNPPISGLNYRTIGGSLCVYLFPAHTSSTLIKSFQLDNSEFYITSKDARIGFTLYTNGVGLYFVTGLNHTSGTLNFSSLIPESSSTVTTQFMITCNARFDSGGMSRRSETAEIQNASAAFVVVHQRNTGKYLKTPTTSGTYFYPDSGERTEIKLSRNIYNFSACKLSYSHDDGVGDGNSNGAWWMTNFTDRAIF